MPAPQRPAAARDLLVIGLTGAVGSGKSAAAEAFESLGCARFDADASARVALDRPEVIDTLRQWWGGEVVGSDGRIDRARVAAIAFADEAERRRLEGLIHPIVRQDLSTAVQAAAASGATAIVLDIPLLYEGGLDAWCDRVVFVDAPRHQRLERVRATRGWSDDELARREAAQLAPAEKRRRADIVIANDDSLATLRRRVRESLERLRRES